MALSNLLKSLSTAQVKQILKDSGYDCDDITSALFVKIVRDNQYQYLVTNGEGAGHVYVMLTDGKLYVDF